MKKFLFFILLFPLIVNSQNIINEVFPTQDGKIVYQEVVNISSVLTTEQMFINAKKWMANSFLSSKEVIQAEDKEAGIIIGKGFIAKGHNPYVIDPKNWFTIKLEFKPDRFRYTIYDVIYTGSVDFMGAHVNINSPIEEWATQQPKTTNEKKLQKIHDSMLTYLSSIDQSFKQTIQSLKKEISQQPDNW